MTLEQQFLKTIWDELTKICFENNVDPKDVKIESLPGIINVILPGAIHKIEIEGHLNSDD